MQIILNFCSDIILIFCYYIKSKSLQNFAYRRINVDDTETNKSSSIALSAKKSVNSELIKPKHSKLDADVNSAQTNPSHFAPLSGVIHNASNISAKSSYADTSTTAETKLKYKDELSVNIDIIEESKEEMDSEKSEDSKRNRSFNIGEEEQKGGEEKDNIYNEFTNNQDFINSTSEFLKKLETHFKNKRSTQECTSFINTVHNLYTQHIGKISK